MTTKMTKPMKQALAALRDGSEVPADVALFTGQRESNARRTLQTLVQVGLVRYVGNDMYVTDEFAGPLERRMNEGASMCVALREIVASWPYGRAEFIRLATEYGIKPGTASTGWSKWRSAA